MECSKVKYLISLYIDGALPEEESSELFKHIELCSHCKEYFDRSIEINKNLSNLSVPSEDMSEELKDKIMNKLKSVPNHKERKARYSRKFALCASIAILILVTPISGKSVLATVGEWVRSLKLQSDNYTMDVIPVEEYVKPESKGVTCIGKSLNFSTLEELKGFEEKSFKPVLPNYIPEGFEFKSAEVDSSDFSSYYILEITYGSIVPNRDDYYRLTIIDRYSPLKWGKSNIILYEKDKAKEVLDGKGTLVKRDWTNFDWLTLHVFDVDDHFDEDEKNSYIIRTVRIDYEIGGNEAIDESIEDELILMYESIENTVE